MHFYQCPSAVLITMQDSVLWWHLILPRSSYDLMQPNRMVCSGLLDSWLNQRAHQIFVIHHVAGEYSTRMRHQGQSDGLYLATWKY